MLHRWKKRGRERGKRERLRKGENRYFLTEIEEKGNGIGSVIFNFLRQ